MESMDAAATTADSPMRDDETLSVPEEHKLDSINTGVELVPTQVTSNPKNEQDSQSIKTEPNSTSGMQDADNPAVTKADSIDAADTKEAKRIKLDPEPAEASTTSEDELPADPDWIPPYDEAIEQKNSKLAVDQPCFRDAEELITLACDTVRRKYDELSSRGYKDPDIDTLLILLNAARNPTKHYDDIGPYGLRGDRGAGKSTLINCLTNQKNAAQESDGATSGTHVAQEFAPNDSPKTSRFRATVYYQPKRKIELLIEKHFQDIYDFKKLNLAELDDDEYADYQANYSTAIEFFTTLLCDRDEFETTTATTNYFDAACCDDLEDHLEVLKDCIFGYLESLNRRVDGTKVVTANDMTELQQELKYFKGPGSAQQYAKPTPSSWPLVHKIVTELKARILSQGVILADLPGTSDTNRLRVQMARDHLKRCDTAIVVHPILRSVGEESVTNSLIEALRGGKHRHVLLVLTNSDRTNASTETVDRNMSEADREKLLQLEDYAKALREKTKEVTQKLRECKQKRGANAADIYMEVSQELDVKKREAAAAQAKSKERVIQLRNQDVVNQTQDYLKQITRSNEEVKIFTVASSVYQQHMEGYEAISPPDMSVEATGIPGLRSFLLSMPASLKLECLQRLGQFELRSILLAMEMQCSKSPLERKGTVDTIIARPEKELGVMIHDYCAKLKDSFLSIMTKVMNSKESHWVKKAEQEHDKWDEYNRSTYSAFCRKDGKWKYTRKPCKDDGGTKKKIRVPVNWNTSINSILEQDMLAAFDNVKSELTEISVDMSSDVDGLPSLLKKLTQDLKGSPELMGVNLPNFYELIDTKCDLVGDRFRTLWKDLDAMVRTICYDATIVTSSNSYLMESMQTAYEECKLEHGTGSSERRRTKILEKLTGPKNVFLDIMTTAGTIFEQYLSEWADRVVRKISREFNDIVQDFNRRFDNVEEEDPIKKDFRNELFETVQKVRLEIVDGKLKEKLDECASYE